MRDWFHKALETTLPYLMVLTLIGFAAFAIVVINEWVTEMVTAFP